MEVVDYVLIAAAVGLSGALVFMLTRPKGQQSAGGGSAVRPDTGVAGRAARPLPTQAPPTADPSPERSARLAALLEQPAATARITPAAQPTILPRPPQPQASTATPTTVLARPVMGLLEVVGGQERGQRFGLLLGENRVGRAPDNHVHLVDEAVSGHHAILQVSPGEIMLFDDSSTNGTFVNGQQVFGPTHLQDGDTLIIGRTAMLLKNI